MPLKLQTCSLKLTYLKVEFLKNAYINLHMANIHLYVLVYIFELDAVPCIVSWFDLW